MPHTYPKPVQSPACIGMTIFNTKNWTKATKNLQKQKAGEEMLKKLENWKHLVQENVISQDAQDVSHETMISQDAQDMISHETQTIISQDTQDMISHETICETIISQDVETGSKVEQEEEQPLCVTEENVNQVQLIDDSQFPLPPPPPYTGLSTEEETETKTELEKS